MTFNSSAYFLASFLLTTILDEILGIAGLGMAIGSLDKSVGWSIVFMVLDISTAGAPGTDGPSLGRPLGIGSSFSLS
jgi:hypothetical protein